MRGRMVALIAAILTSTLPQAAAAQSAGWLPPVRIAVVWPHDSALIAKGFTHYGPSAGLPIASDLATVEGF